MALSRPIYTGIWMDKTFRNLSYVERLVLLFLQANDRFEQLAIYKIPIDYIAFINKIPQHEVEDILNKFENELGLIKYSHKTEEIALLDYNEHGIINSNAKGTSFDNCFTNIEKKVKDKSLLLAMYNSSLKYADANKGNERFNKAMESMKNCLIGWGYDLQQHESATAIEVESPPKVDKQISPQLKNIHERIAVLEEKLRENRGYVDEQFISAREHQLGVSNVEDCSDMKLLNAYIDHMKEFII